MQYSTTLHCYVLYMYCTCTVMYVVPTTRNSYGLRTTSVRVELYIYEYSYNVGIPTCTSLELRV